MEGSIPEVFLPVKDYIVHLEDFDLVKIIGRGSYGEVYYAIHKTTGTKTALKKLLVDELDEVQLEYFIREVLILAYYNNFFLVSFLGFSPTNPFLIVTEFVPCGSLYDALHGRPGSPILNGTDKTKIAIGIIEGMICLHANRILHRDLKSLNILLDEHNLPKICDFGISRAIDEENQMKMTLRIGTFHWMAPEMLDSDNYSYKVDVYAFSIMLWEMITSNVPYQGLDPLKILINVKNNGMRPPIPSDCNEDLVKLMVRCWDQDPDNRPTFCELYDIFRDQNIHFNGANTDEIRQFFEQFPISDDILHPKATTNNNDTKDSNENDKTANIEPDNKEEINNDEINNEENKYDNINNETSLNDTNNDIKNDINTNPQFVMNSQVSKLNYNNNETEKDLNPVDEELVPTDDNEIHIADHYMTQQRKTHESLINYNLHQAQTLNTIDNNSNESFKVKNKKKDKKKEKDKDKTKNKSEKEKKKEEKKKRKTDTDLTSDDHQNLRRMNSNATFGKKLNEEYPGIKNYNQQNQANKVPPKSKKADQQFDKIYDFELNEMKKRKVPINTGHLSNADIHHHRKELKDNIFSKFINSIEEGKQKLPYFIPLHNFKNSESPIYTSDKDNIFLNPNRFPNAKEISVHETESFIIDDYVFKNYVNSSSLKRSSKISTTPASSVKKYNLLIDSNGTAIEEEEEINEDENIEDMLRQSSGRGKLINIFKAELDEITPGNSIEVFNDLKNIFQQRFNTNDDRKKDDVYIFLLANLFKDKGELINQFNEINGFNMLPITGNSLITPSFITLFSACILFDIKRFPFKVYENVFIKDSYRNTGKFLLLLQALDTAIQNNIFNDAKDRLKVKDAFTNILDHFFDKAKYYQEFNEYPQFLFSIYTRLIAAKGVFNDDFLLSFRYQLIDISNNIIISSNDVKCIKTALLILVSKQIDAVKLLTSQSVKRFKIPLRSILNHIKPQSELPPTSTIEKIELVPYVSSLFAQFQQPPISSTLITTLAESSLFFKDASLSSTASSAACLTLCRVARTKRGSFLLAEKSASWLGLFVSEAERSLTRLNEIKEKGKSGIKTLELKKELVSELQNVSWIEKRASLCLRILLVIFTSHVGAIDVLSKQNIFLRFLSNAVNSSYFQSICVYNTANDNGTEIAEANKSLIDILRSVYAILRRIKPKFASSERLNDSLILNNICTKVLSRKITDRNPKAAELALQIIDLLVRAAAKSNQEEEKGSAPDLNFVGDFVNRLPSLLVIGGAVSHKAIITSISVFVLQPNSTKIAMKNELNIRSIQSRSALNSNIDGELEDCHNVSMTIRKILPKVDLIGGFDKYRNTLLEILNKNE